jgi:hypothetical protein
LEFGERFCHGSALSVERWAHRANAIMQGKLHADGPRKRRDAVSFLPSVHPRCLAYNPSHAQAR